MHLLVTFLFCLAMQSRSAPAPQVVGIGYPGFNTLELRERLPEALQSVKPNYVVILAGANDASNPAKFLPPENTYDNLRDMVRRAKTSGAKVLLILVHDPDLSRLMKRHRPEEYGSVPATERLDAVRKAIARVADEERTPLIDFRSALARAGGADEELSTDGVHLTAKGYGLLASAVRSKLPPHLTAQDTILCFGDSLTYGQGVRGFGVPETPETYPSQLRALLSK
jgi:acyl-CoA thioesterase I